MGRFAILIIVASVSLIAGALYSIVQHEEARAAAPVPEWHRVGPYSLYEWCNPETGDRLYSSSQGLAVVPGGCQ